MGSQGFYVCRLHLDPCPHVAVVWQKKRGFLVAVLTIVRTHYAFSQKLATGMNNFLHFRIYLLNLSFCHYFDQGKRSCPGASCFGILLYFGQQSRNIELCGENKLS